MYMHDGDLPPQWPEPAPEPDPAPGWATALRNLYDAVADEPIPSDFARLLARLERRDAPDSTANEDHTGA